jgi:hypothetical protein
VDSRNAADPWRTSAGPGTSLQVSYEAASKSRYRRESFLSVQNPQNRALLICAGSTCLTSRASVLLQRMCLFRISAAIGGSSGTTTPVGNGRSCETIGRLAISA